MALDIARLNNVQQRGGNIIAQCPACAENGRDKHGNHLTIDTEGRFACVVNPGAAGAEHRKRIFELVGIRDTAPRSETESSRPTPKRSDPDEGRGHQAHQAHQEQREQQGASPKKRVRLGDPVAFYDYHDADGNVRYRVVRYEPEGERSTFRQERFDGERFVRAHGCMEGVGLLLYKTPDVLAAAETGEVVLVVEGEKDADTADRIGILATCNTGGAGKWAQAYTDTLKGVRVVVVPDNDEPGEAHARLVADSLLGSAESVHVAKLPNKFHGKHIKDLTDFVEAGATLDDVLNVLDAATKHSAANAECARPDAIRTEMWKISQEKKLSRDEINSKSADAVIAWLQKRGTFYHHEERRDFANGLYFDAVRKLLSSVQSDSFCAWMSETLAINRAERIFYYITNAVETAALGSGSRPIIPSAIWERKDGAFYLSCGAGEMVRIRAGSVRKVDNGTDGVLFLENDVLAPWSLAEPRDPFEACSLFRDMQAADKHTSLLFRLWAISLPTNPATKPPLCATSPVGGGKTRIVRGLFELYGMPPRISTVNKNGEADLWVALDSGGLTCIDNVDKRLSWLPDALAAAATAGTMEKRTLYTDKDKTVLKSRAWIALTSANPSFASDAGLADRLIVVRMNRREKTVSDRLLSEEIAAARNAGLTWICDVLARALADTSPVDRDINKRHPDFAEMAIRIGRAMGRGADAVDAIRRAEADKALFGLENDYIGAAILEVARSGTFVGSARELLDRITAVDDSLAGTVSAKKLSRRLSRLWPHLESILSARIDGNGAGGERIYRLAGLE